MWTSAGPQCTNLAETVHKKPGYFSSGWKCSGRALWALGPTQGWREHNPPPHHHSGTFTPQSPQLYPYYPVGQHREQIIKEFFFFLTRGYFNLHNSVIWFQTAPQTTESRQQEGWQTLTLSHRSDTEGAKSLQQLCCQSQRSAYPWLDVTVASVRQFGKKYDRSQCFRNWCNLLFWHPKSMIH